MRRFSNRNCVQSAVQIKSDKNFTCIQCADKERYKTQCCLCKPLGTAAAGSTTGQTFILMPKQQYQNTINQMHYHTYSYIT